jgi:hypothetical protein
MLKNVHSNGVLMFDMNIEKGVITKDNSNNDRTTVMRLMPVEKD